MLMLYYNEVIIIIISNNKCIIIRVYMFGFLCNVVNCFFRLKLIIGIVLYVWILILLKLCIICIVGLC